MPVRTRFAPSPSGPLHLGGARTALFAWLEAKARGGSFVLRFEDTDASRSSKEYADRIAEALQWLGISIDQGPFYQRQHGERHREVAAALLAAGHAYRCYCSQEEITEMRNQAKAQGLKPRYDGRCRNRAKPGDGSHVIRFCTPASGTINIEDKVQGNITFANEELDDLVIIRADGSATYHLAVVVDDHDIGVTDVTRGADHLNNTPRQIHIIDAIGAARPSYAHLPLLLGAGGKPMSKRDSAADILGYRDQGFLATAM
ncbi:MAG: glutamate--tRNA ligase, partial [Candidatus Porifericomitaceae bacterium WSBS_2022_MAG_OTU9]